MDPVPTPKQLRGAGAVAVSLAYFSGLAGVVAGGLLYQGGDTGFAFVVWIVTFAMGALLMIASFLVRGMAGMMARLEHMEQGINVVVRRDAGAVERALPRDDHPNPW